ncbi:MAG: hypothetical protein HY847_19845 [Betaproteobacteria bacterium]|nr:hypothetical protein [Betaproteobacteria bacterium]
MTKRCVACGKKFEPRPQARNQTYCSAHECQRERRRAWQKKERRTDAMYRKDDADYNKQWAKNNPGYWEKYRAENPEYTERNRKKQHVRNLKHRYGRNLHSKTTGSAPPLPSGRYWLTTIGPDGIAKGDASIVEITFISGTTEGTIPGG